MSRALGGLSHSGRPDEAAAVVQAAFRGRRVRVATAAARQARRERSAGLLQCRVRLLLARRARLDALACRLQHALRTYLNRTLPASTKSALRRDVLRSRQSVAEQEAALAKKDEALERLIERQLSRFGYNRAAASAASASAPVAVAAPVAAAPLAAPMAMPMAMPMAAPVAIARPPLAGRASVGMPMAQSPVPIGPPMASMSPMATMAMPMASAVPVPVAMERDAAARLRDAEVLCTRLETEKDDLASQLNEALEHNHQLAEEATALRFAKDAAEECASQLLAQRLREEDEKDDDGPLGAPVVSGPTQ